MKAIAMASSKGGVGKTTAAVHLAVGLARQRQRVLLVDLDPSGHATSWLLGPDRPQAGIAEALTAGQLRPDHLVELADRPGLHLAPSTAGLEGVEGVLAKQFGREMVLAGVLKGARDLVDMVVMDCPPSAGFLTQSAVHAATHVLIPVTAGHMGLAGLQDILSLVDQVHARSRSRVRMLGQLMFAADDREGVTQETRDMLAGNDLYSAEVRLSTAAKRLPAHRMTAWDPGADERGAADYAAILRETSKRLARGAA